jgi:hypothetical protein
MPAPASALGISRCFDCFGARESEGERSDAMRVPGIAASCRADNGEGATRTSEEWGAL